MNTSLTPEPTSTKTNSSGLAAVLRKELKRFFTDKRLVITTVILPGLLFFLLYSFMGGAMTSYFTVGSDYTPQVYVVNLPQTLAAVTSEAGLEFERASTAEIDTIKQQVAEKTIDLLVVFPEDFDERIAQLANGNAGIAGVATLTSPEVSLFYNSTRVESAAAYSRVFSLLGAVKDSLQPAFSVNTGTDTFDLASQEDSAGFIFSMLLPMVLLIILFSSCMSVAPESIAGEKERGTIATLLVTPLKRWELALGKIISLCLIALLAGASSFVGVMLSIPRLLGNAASDAGEDAVSSLLSGVSVYGVQDYLMLLAVIFSTVLLFIGLISIISAFARSVKEASTMVMPLMIVVMLVGVSAMFQMSSTTEPLFYLIPLYNSVQSLASVFSFSAEPLLIILTVIVNCLVAAVCVIVLTRMFESERIIFSK